MNGLNSVGGMTQNKLDIKPHFNKILLKTHRNKLIRFHPKKSDMMEAVKKIYI